MSVQLHILRDYVIGETPVRTDQFIEMEDTPYVDDLVKAGVARRESPADFEQRLANERAAAEKKKLADLISENTTKITRIKDRAEDDPTGGFKGISHFAHDVWRACKQGASPSLELTRWKNMCSAKDGASKSSATKTYAIEADDSQGGYLVPPQYAAALMKTTLEKAIVRPRATFMPMQTNRISVNAIVDNDHSTNLFGGIVLYRPGEDDSKTESKPTYRQVELTLHNLVGLIGVSDELIEDSPISMEPLLTDLFGEAIAFTEDDDFINGTGINQPLGINNSPAMISQAAVVGQAADTVVFQNITAMWSRMHPSCHSNAIWICNNDVLPQLYQMNLAVGTGGSVAFLPAGGLSDSPYASLMGRPLIPTEKCPTLGDTGDIILVDWSKYLIGGKAGASQVKTASSIHFWFNYDRQAFRFVLRYDGQPWWTSALTPLRSAITLSPFVRLEAR